MPAARRASIRSRAGRLDVEIAHLESRADHLALGGLNTRDVRPLHTIFSFGTSAPSGVHANAGP
jgi:hypothetical protein